MRPFREEANRIRWSPDEHEEDYVVGYDDRIERRILEMPLSSFLASEIPAHRARYLKRTSGRGAEEIVWDRRR